ncbi:MAG: 4Fe-4S binding protein [Dehalococcoidia bacterium]|nr:4Fe-4S binding protein [Dehalococcoidia bacterium]MDD5493173.1 4Fe-4S binding protein [Dehalococcoidia bacterium]
MHHPIFKHILTEYIRLDTRLCRACWNCVDSCPNGVIGKTWPVFHKHAHIDYAGRCKGCLKCVSTCPYHAVIIRRYRTKNNQTGRSSSCEELSA